MEELGIRKVVRDRVCRCRVNGCYASYFVKNWEVNMCSN